MYLLILHGKTDLFIVGKESTDMAKERGTFGHLHGFLSALWNDLPEEARAQETL
jgi:hypothetical protein